jgi:hypothetical protein
MAKPTEIQLEPGWLEDDVRRAKSRLNEWSATSLRVAAASPQSHSATSSLSRHDREQQSNSQVLERSKQPSQ